MGPGQLIRVHRRRRRLSQVELAGAAGISARHLSFVENGRSRPGRPVLAALARGLGLPARQVNRLMRAAGERPQYPEHALEDATARPLRWALERMLDAHMPLPAMVTDHAWNLVRENPAFAALRRELGTLAHRGAEGRSMMEWLFAADGLRPLVSNWDVVGPLLLERVRHEALVHPDLDWLVEHLEAHLGETGARNEADDADVVVPLHMVLGGDDLRLFTVLASFGSALDAHLQSLRIEYFFPVDEATRRYLEALVARGAEAG